VFEKILNVFRIDDLRKKIVTTLILLFVFRIGSQIPIPGVSLQRVQQVLAEFERQGAESNNPFGGFFTMVGVLSAGGLLQISIFSLGIMPYISSSIIFSILAKVVPAIEKVVKEGSQGQKRLNQWMRWGTVPICIVQAAFVVKGVIMNPESIGFQGVVIVNPADWAGSFPGIWLGFFVPAVIALTCGTLFLMWIGEQITEHGVGNGISLLIMAGILARMERMGEDLFRPTGTGDADSAFAQGMLKTAAIIVLYLAVSMAVVYVTKGSRRIPIQYARMVRGRGVYGGQKHYLPLKVNQANVMPVIFSSSLLAFPAVIFSMLEWSYAKDMFNKQHASWTYTFLDVSLIFFFSFFWVQLMLQPGEMAKNMKEYGAFIPGIRPGKATADFLDKVMFRLTLAGAFFLVFISLLPQVVSNVMGVSYQSATFLGGTSILIVVAVALDLVDRMNAQLLMRNYEGFMKGTPRMGQ
jgi:preprotein translocase subunit SecY